MPLPGLDLDRMIALVRKGLGGIDDQDLPDEDAIELLNMALWEIEDRFQFKEKECIIQSLLEIGRNDYPVANDHDALWSISVRGTDDDDNYQWEKMERMSPALWDEIRNDDASDNAWAFPTKYVRINQTIFLWPPPDKEYPIQIIYWRSLQSLLDGVVDTTGLPRNWDELVVEGAIVRGHFYAQDYNLARQASDMQTSKVRGAVLSANKEEKFDSRWARMHAVIDESDLESLPGEDPLSVLRPFITRSRGV